MFFCLILAVQPLQATADQGISISNLVWEESLHPDGLMTGHGSWELRSNTPAQLIHLFVDHPDGSTPKINEVRLRSASGRNWIIIPARDEAASEAELSGLSAYYDSVRSLSNVQILLHYSLSPGQPLYVEIDYEIEAGLTAYRDAQIINFVPVPQDNPYPIERLACQLNLPYELEAHTVRLYSETKPFASRLLQPLQLDYQAQTITTLHEDLPAGLELNLSVALPEDYLIDPPAREDRSILGELDRGLLRRSVRADNSGQLSDLISRRLPLLLSLWLGVFFGLLLVIKLISDRLTRRRYPAKDRCGPAGRYRYSAPTVLSLPATSFLRRRRSLGSGVYACLVRLSHEGYLKYSNDRFSAPAIDTGPVEPPVSATQRTVLAVSQKLLSLQDSFSTQQLLRMSRSRSQAGLMNDLLVQIGQATRSEVVAQGLLTGIGLTTVVGIVLAAISLVLAALIFLSTGRPMSLWLALPAVFTLVAWLNNVHRSRKGEAVNREIWAFRRYLTHFAHLQPEQQPAPEDWTHFAIIAVALECEERFLQQLSKISTMEERVAVGFYRRLGGLEQINIRRKPQGRHSQLNHLLAQRLRVGRLEMSATLLYSLRRSS